MGMLGRVKQTLPTEAIGKQKKKKKKSTRCISQGQKGMERQKKKLKVGVARAVGGNAQEKCAVGRESVTEKKTM